MSNMQEKNRDTLRRALDRLPEYEPPAGLWHRLDGGLDHPTPAPGLDRLPGYAPPPQVWNQLSRSLDQSNRRQLRHRRYTWMAVAASVLVLVGVWFTQQYNAPKVTLSYTTEAAPPPVNADWDEEETAFAQLFDDEEADADPVLNSLRLELLELTDAKEEVKAMLVQYGEDADLVRQLGDIERERSELYRQVVSYEFGEE